MERSWLKKVLLLPAAIAFLLTGASLAKAQSVTFSGRVTSSDGQPLAGASVGITDLEVGAVTNEQGQYTFTARAARATGRTLIVVARHIGYKPARYTARISTDAVQHDFSINGRKTKLLSHGQSDTLRVTFLRKGTYPYKCTVDSHSKLGMKGVFTIT